MKRKKVDILFYFFDSILKIFIFLVFSKTHDEKNLIKKISEEEEYKHTESQESKFSKNGGIGPQ